MSLVSCIKVQNVRVHKAYGVDILPSTTVITGANGSGKTSLIEALYIALQGSSFRGGDNDVLRGGASWYRIDIDFDDGETRTVKFDTTRTSGKKTFVIHNESHYRILPRFKYPVVLFEPDDLRLLSGSPSRRRDYFDRLIGQLDPLYATAVRKYERALRQRNNLLKQARVQADELFAWDVTLSEYGAYITKQRSFYIQRIQEQFESVYNKIAGVRHEVAITYPYATSKQKILTDLHGALQKDQMTGHTSVGPHRHDILFTYNNAPALSVASRGEVRSVMLALKFIEVDILQDVFHVRPIILLDDVFSELDATRQRHLVDNFKNHQVIITSATSKAKSTHRIGG